METLNIATSSRGGHKTRKTEKNRPNRKIRFKRFGFTVGYGFNIYEIRFFGSVFGFAPQKIEITEPAILLLGIAYRAFL